MAVQAFLWFLTTYQWNINSDFYNRSHVDINRRDSVTGLNVFFFLRSSVKWNAEARKLWSKKR